MALHFTSRAESNAGKGLRWAKGRTGRKGDKDGLTVELHDVDAAFDKAKASGIPFVFGPLDELWGDRHFAVLDPSGIPVDFVRHTPPQAS